MWQMWVGRCVVLTDLSLEMLSCPVICRFHTLAAAPTAVLLKARVTPGHSFHHQENRMNQSMEK